VFFFFFFMYKVISKADNKCVFIRVVTKNPLYFV